MYRTSFLFCCIIVAAMCTVCLLTLMRATAQDDPILIPDINPDHSLEEQRNVELTKNLLQTFTTGNREYLLNSVSSDVVWDVMGSPMYIQTSGRWIGPAGINDFFDTASSLWSTQSFQADHIWADGPVVIVSGRETDTALATGKQIEQNWLIVLTYRENLLLQAQVYGDGAAQFWSLMPL